MPISNKVCEVDECGRSIVMRAPAVCLMHYKRLRKHGTTDKHVVVYKKRSCSAVGCDTKYGANGYCIKHLRQMEKYGHILTDQEKTLHRAEAARACSKGKTPLDKLERNKFTKEIGSLVLARDNYTCRVCDEQSRYLHVDHIKSWSKHPELRFDTSNCRTVCRPCHYYITFKRTMPVGSKWGIKSLKKEAYYAN